MLLYQCVLLSSFVMTVRLPCQTRLLFSLSVIHPVLNLKVPRSEMRNALILMLEVNAVILFVINLFCFC